VLGLVSLVRSKDSTEELTMDHLPRYTAAIKQLGNTDSDAAGCQAGCGANIRPARSAI
jgi:hypothetical protein